MTLLMTVFAAITCTVIWYNGALKSEMKVGTLCWMFWGASLMWLVDAIFEYAELGAEFFTPAPIDMLYDFYLGLSVIALASYRAGVYPELLKQYHSGMDVGHHVAYKTAVSVFYGDCAWDEADNGDNDLDSAIVLYGLSAYLEHIGQPDEAKKYLEKTLKNDSVWPCISYLAAWNEFC